MLQFLLWHTLENGMEDYNDVEIQSLVPHFGSHGGEDEDVWLYKAVAQGHERAIEALFDECGVFNDDLLCEEVVGPQDSGYHGLQKWQFCCGRKTAHTLEALERAVEKGIGESCLPFGRGVWPE